MRAISIAIAALVLAGVVHTRRADACGQAGPSDNTIAALGVYLVGTAAFGVKDVVTSDPSVGYGVVETLYNAPAAIAWSLAVHDELRSPYVQDDAIRIGVAFIAIHTALAAHGVYTVAKRRDRKDKNPVPRPYNGPPGLYDSGPPGLMQVGSVSANVTAAPIANGGGIGLSGTF